MSGSRYGHYALPKNRRFLDLLAREADLARRRMVLDAGCGYGYVSRFLADHTPESARVVGMDVADRMLDRARGLADSRLSFVKASLAALPFADGAFDLVVSNSVLEHVPISLRRRALAEIVRVLSDDGAAVVGVPTTLHKFWTLPHLTFHDKHVLGIAMTAKDLAGPRGWWDHWREIVTLPYLMLRECADHWPGAWKRLFADVPARVERLGMNLVSNRAPVVNALARWEARVARKPVFRDLGTSMIFILRKAPSCASS